jgi:hypothetical protein
LRNKRALLSARKKLADLHEIYAKAKAALVENVHTRELTLHSLRRTMNQFTEEIVWFESREFPSTDVPPETTMPE